jgi:hypothetical protein
MPCLRRASGAAREACPPAVDIEDRELHGAPPSWARMLTSLPTGRVRRSGARPPELVSGSVFDRKAGRPHRFQCGIDIIHLDREIGNQRPRATFTGDADPERSSAGASRMS